MLHEDHRRMHAYVSHPRLVSATHIPTRGAGRFVSRADATCCATAFKSSAWTAAKSDRFVMAATTLELQASERSHSNLPPTYLFTICLVIVLLQELLLLFVGRFVDSNLTFFCNHGFRLFVPSALLRVYSRPSMHNSTWPLAIRKL